MEKHADIKIIGNWYFYLYAYGSKKSNKDSLIIIETIYYQSFFVLNINYGGKVELKVNIMNYILRWLSAQWSVGQ